MSTAYIISVTAIIFDFDRVLITKRLPNASRFPGRWTVPGGRLEPADYTDIQPTADGVRYGAIETALRREVQEEVGLEIGELQYIASMVMPGDTPRIFLSFSTTRIGGELRLQEAEVAAAQWVTRFEVQQMRQGILIDGISDEIEHAFDLRSKFDLINVIGTNPCAEIPFLNELSGGARHAKE